MSDRDPASPAGLATSPTEGSRASDVLVKGVWHRYERLDVLADVTIDVEHGELLTLLGPSGSGKSTLLRIIGGLERARAGTVEIGGRDVTRMPPERREVGVVFQNYALFPHMTVAQNVAFPLRMRRMDRDGVRQRIARMLEIVGLTGMERRRPAELSGGQQQRVAVARALVFEPRVLLLDEPFGALDRRLRDQLGLEVRRVQRELGITTIFVTHDQDEAFTMSTRIAVMGHGRILQTDIPTEMYRQPSCLEVARYLGHLNEFPVTVTHGDDAAATVEGPCGIRFTKSLIRKLVANAEVVCGVRPEDVLLETSAHGTPTTSGKVEAAIFKGDSIRAQIAVGAEMQLLAVLSSGAPSVTDGDHVSVEIQRAMLFDQTTGARVDN